MINLLCDNSPIIPPQDILDTTTQYNLTALQGAPSQATSDKRQEVSQVKGLTIFAPGTKRSWLSEMPSPA